MSTDIAFPQFPTLMTTRLQLRSIESIDAAALFAFKSDREVMDFYGDEPHQSLAETQALIDALHQAYEQREAIHWGITQGSRMRNCEKGIVGLQ